MAGTVAASASASTRSSIRPRGVPTNAASGVTGPVVTVAVMADTDRTWPTGVDTVIGEPIPSDQLSDAFASAAGPLGECRVVLSAWLIEPNTAEVTFGRLAELAVRYASRLEATGVASFATATVSDAAAFVHAPTRRGAAPAVHTMHLRRTVLRSIYRSLHRHGIACGDPTAFIELPSRWYRAQRPLSDAELHQLRAAISARRGDPPAGAVILALAEAGASTAELTLIRWVDLNRDSVSLPGGTRIFPRQVTLTDWGATIINRALSAATPDPDGLVVGTSTKPPGSQPAQSAMTSRLRQLLRTAELHTTPGVGPRSIRLWAARRAYRREGRIEDAAHVLGMRSLDATADAIAITYIPISAKGTH